MDRTTNHVLPALAAALTLTLAGCAVPAGDSDGSSSTSEPATETVTETVTETAEPAEEAEPAEATEATEAGEAGEGESAPAGEDADRSDNMAPFGDTLRRDDGLEVTVSAPEVFTPSEWAVTGSPEHVSFEVTITNGMDEPFDPSMLFPTVTSAGAEGEEVFDSENGFDGAPMTTLLPGKSVTFPVGFGVEDPEDVLMEIELDWDTQPAIFGTESALS